MAHPVRPDEYLEINNFYTATVYEKGAEVIRMLHTLLGAGVPARHGSLLRAPRRPGGDLRRFRAGDGGRHRRRPRAVPPLVRQAGTPVVVLALTTTPGRVVTRSTSAQSLPTPPARTPSKLPFHIPFAVGLVGPDGDDMPLRLEGETARIGTTRLLELPAAGKSFLFLDVPRAPVPSLLRDFSAPVSARVRLHRSRARAPRRARQRRRQPLGRRAVELHSLVILALARGARARRAP